MKIILGESAVLLTEDQLAAFNGLTKLQKTVSLKKLEGLSDIDAYIQGGGKAKSANSRAVSASEILNNPNARQFIDSFNGQIVGESIMGRQEMLERLTLMARTDITDVVNIHNKVVVEGPDGDIEQSFWSIKNEEDIAEGGKSVISELTASKEGTKIKIHDSKAAMKQIADIEGFNAPKEVDLKTPITLIPTLTQEQALQLLKKNGVE